MSDNDIKYVASCSFKRGRVKDGVIEVRIKGVGSKFLPWLEFKEKFDLRSMNQTSKINSWLNSEEGKEWALNVKAAKLPI